MTYPDFYDRVVSMNLYDPLSDFLGAIDKGIVEIEYLDCVKLAGHSCPTVAGAYLMTLMGLQKLYPDTHPVRGTINVEMREAETEGVTGVVANVIAYIVGASGKGGFKGIQGNFSRDNLIAFSQPIDGEVRLTRLDTQESVTLSYDPSIVPPDPKMQPLMAKALQGTATPEEQALFKQLWQERVARILTDMSIWDKLITIKEAS
jgi:hypothetical protein